MRRYTSKTINRCIANFAINTTYVAAVHLALACGNTRSDAPRRTSATQLALNRLCPVAYEARSRFV